MRDDLPQTYEWARKILLQHTIKTEDFNQAIQILCRKIIAHFDALEADSRIVRAALEGEDPPPERR
jgi:hypothetical protein